MRITNPNDKVIPMYWWSNIAVVEEEGKRVIAPAEEAYTAFPDGKGSYYIRKIPIPHLQGIDITYPTANKMSMDYFWNTLSKKRKYVCELNKDGYGLVQVSTERLKGRKLFVWGNSQGGHKWMNFLTDDHLSGSYNEIQCGLANTQYESIPMPPRTVWEWMEGYGAMHAEPKKAHGTWQEAREEVEMQLGQMISEEKMEDLLNTTRDMAKKPAEKIIFHMSGWGALELYRRSKEGKNLMNDHLDFGEMGEEQADWKRLLEEGTVGEHFSEEIPVSYQRQREWLQLLESAIKEKDKDNWYAYYLYGTAMIAEGELDRAENNLRKSLELEETAWGNYALAICLGKAGDSDGEQEYLLKAHEQRKEDVSLAKELFHCLYMRNDAKRTVTLFEAAAESIKQNNRCLLYYAYALMRQDRFLEAEEIICKNGALVVPDIREGDLIVTNLWYEIQRKKGLSPEQAGNPPRDLDFRMYAGGIGEHRYGI